MLAREAGMDSLGPETLVLSASFHTHPGMCVLSLSLTHTDIGSWELGMK